MLKKIVGRNENVKNRDLPSAGTMGLKCPLPKIQKKDFNLTTNFKAVASSTSATYLGSNRQRRSEKENFEKTLPLTLNRYFQANEIPSLAESTQLLEPKNLNRKASRQGVRFAENTKPDKPESAGSLSVPKRNTSM